ncbi:MAG: restriction endonuclease subunit S [Clostridia bacterium]|nr:restriction endonuclease subunit S [Clostridia bacterium]
MKNSNIQWIGQIPDRWKLIRLKDWCVNKKEIAGEKSGDYERLALTLNGVIKREKNDSDGLQPKEFDTYQILEKNDFVFKMIDLQNISTSRVGLSSYTGLVSPAYIRFTPRKEGQLNKFIYYYLMSMYYNCVFNSMGGDGVRSALNATDMGNFKCPFPAIEEQQKVVFFLDTKSAEIDGLIEIENRQIEKLKEYKQAVITEAVTKGLDKSAPMKDSGVDWIGKIPEGWSVKKLKYAYQNRNEKYVSGILPYIALENIESMSGKYIFTETNSNYLLDGSIFAKKNDVLFGKLRPYLAKSLVVNEDSYVSPEFAVFYDVTNLSAFLKYLFLSASFIDVINSSTYGTKMPRANVDFISNLYIALPSLYEQNQIAYYLDKKSADIDFLIEIKQKKIDKLNEYKKSLIYEYVTGKKEVV